MLTRRYGISCLIFTSISLFAQQPIEEMVSTNLPIHHFANKFFETLETKDIMPTDIALRTKPLSRKTVLRKIFELETVLENSPDVLTKTEEDLFTKLKGEFSDEIWLSGGDVLESENHFFNWNTSESYPLSYVTGDAVLDQAFQINRWNKEKKSNENVSFTKTSARVRGVLRENLAFYSDFSSTLIKGTKKSYRFGQNSQGGVINYNPASSNVYALEADAYFVYEPSWIRILFGKESVSWGPGHHNNLLLSDNAPSFIHLRLESEFERIKFTYLHGWLRSDPKMHSVDSFNLSDQKYIVAHRLEFKVFPWLFIAGNESVIYGGRSVDPGYLNPIIPYHITEQYLGDKDNNTLSFDATLFPSPGWKTYAALYLDDFTTARNPFTYWKQTWAIMLGAQYAFANMSLRGEYARVEPYVYAHKYALLNYSHFGYGLGSSLQPNSDNLFLEGEWKPAREIELALSYELNRHGMGNIERFGYEDGFNDDPKDTGKKHFLMGIREITNSIGFRGTYEVLNNSWGNHIVYLNYNFSTLHNYQNISGRNLIRQHALMGYRIDY